MPDLFTDDADRKALSGTVPETVYRISSAGASDPADFHRGNAIVSHDSLNGQHHSANLQNLAHQ
jgi:hypothetical protein